MQAEYWYMLIGLVLFSMALSHHQLKHSPVTTSIIYLITGFILGPMALDLVTLDPMKHTDLLERVAEVTVIVALFTAGLKLRLPLSHKWWRVPVSLAFISMTITVGLISLGAHYLLSLSWGAAVLLGAVMAPTDPVLASDVQLESPQEKDELKFAITGEAGFNDGTAFPFVMLGVGLLGLHDIGENGLRWFTHDVLWAIGGGFAIGTVSALIMCHIDVKVRSRFKENAVLDDFLALALISSSYGLALWANTYGFLAVFAAAVTTRQLELRTPEWKRFSPHKDRASAVLAFNEQLERLCEVVVVIALGSMLTWDNFTWTIFFSAMALFLLVRPLSVWAGLGFRCSLEKFGLISWFGIRGVGSLYYLFHGINYGVSSQEAQTLISITFGIIAISILVHGVSVTPIMKKFHE